MRKENFGNSRQAPFRSTNDSTSFAGALNEPASLERGQQRGCFLVVEFRLVRDVGGHDNSRVALANGREAPVDLGPALRQYHFRGFRCSGVDGHPIDPTLNIVIEATETALDDVFVHSLQPRGASTLRARQLVQRQFQAVTLIATESMSLAEHLKRQFRFRYRLCDRGQTLARLLQ